MPSGVHTPFSHKVMVTDTKDPGKGHRRAEAQEFAPSSASSSFLVWNQAERPRELGLAPSFGACASFLFSFVPPAFMVGQPERLEQTPQPPLHFLPFFTSTTTFTLYFFLVAVFYFQLVRLSVLFPPFFNIFLVIFVVFIPLLYTAHLFVIEIDVPKVFITFGGNFRVSGPTLDPFGPTLKILRAPTLSFFWTGLGLL